MKKIFLLTICCLLSFYSFTQKTFYLKIKYDSVVNINQIHIDYFNGKNNIPINFKIHNKTINVLGKFNCKFVPLTITFYDKKQGFNNVFFLKPGNSTINIYNNENDTYKYTCINASLIDDTATNYIYREIFNARVKSSKPISELWRKYTANEIFSNDSLKNLLNERYKELNKQTINCIKQFKNEYVSLWYFRTQVVEPSLRLFKNDTLYLKELLKEFVETFSINSQNSYEVKNISLSLSKSFNTNLKNIDAPLFSFKDINNRDISLKNLHGKYVLLDFWATWCAPCIKSIHNIDLINNKYGKKLAIIGVNIDADPNLLKKAIIKYNIKWPQIFDKNSDLTNLFSVDRLPTFVLIDKFGKIIFRGEGLEDKEMLYEILTDKLN